MRKTIKKDVSAEITVKKSKFIANMFYVQTEEDVNNILKNIRKKYYNAKHNCYAFSITNQNGNINRMSDDGEPSNTAGAPMLNIINKNELSNILIVVTRYFGGILLGTGGLVKAYSDVTIKAIENAEIVKEEIGLELKIVLDYKEFEKLSYYCQINKLNIINVEYEEKIICIIEMNNQEKDKIIKNINEMNFKIEKYEVIKQKNIRKNIEI